MTKKSVILSLLFLSMILSSALAVSTNEPPNELVSPRLQDACRKLGIRAPEYLGEPDIVVEYYPERVANITLAR